MVYNTECNMVHNTVGSTVHNTVYNKVHSRVHNTAVDTAQDTAEGSKDYNNIVDSREVDNRGNSNSSSSTESNRACSTESNMVRRNTFYNLHMRTQYVILHKHTSQLFVYCFFVHK